MTDSTLITFGGFAFSVNGNQAPKPATRKARALMAFLVMNRNVDTARERLLELFWPDADPDRARDSLNVALWSIRRCLKATGVDLDQFLIATKSVVRWTGDTGFDASHFSELARRDDAAASEEALQLYRGDFLEGDYDNWTVAERERLAALYEGALARVVRTSKDAELAQRFIARNPYDEHAYATLIEAELAAGRRSSAAGWVDRCRKALSELGERPSAEFEQKFGNVIRITPLVSDELTLPFAGRDTELALLAARLADAGKGRGSATFVLGEAGIGKSTLLNRVASMAGESGLRVLIVRCDSDVQATFGPWRVLFKAVGAGDFDTFIRAHASDVAGAVAQAIAAQITEPVTLFVDDVHGLTGEAFEIFVALTREVVTVHAVIAGARLEGVASIRSRFADVPFEELLIGRLDRSNLKWALSQVLGSDQAEVLEVLYERTGGHPLFFTGLLNALVSTGTLARDGNRWLLAKPIAADLELPETVRRFIETRLQARGDRPRAIACALALEPSANADDLAAVLRYDEPTTLDALDDLLALGLITQPTSGSQFAFAHDLIREVAAAGANAGRRMSLHRAFAQRLRGNGELHASLRLAHHLEAAGDLLAAARSFLKSAQEALEVNAAQDAINRCEAGIRAADRLGRTSDRDLALSSLHRTAAHAALTSGDVHDAISRARNAVTFASTADDVRESAQALLDLAAIQGAAFHLADQNSDASVALERARSCGDQTLTMQAFVQQAKAMRELGMRDDALRVSQAAYELALGCGRSDASVEALQEVLCTQLTWWLFSDALHTARVGLDVARRSEPLVEAAFLYARSGLWYLLERYDDATSEVQTALRITNETSGRGHTFGSPTHPQPHLQFACYYMAGKIAVAQGHWDEALSAADIGAGLTNIAKLPRHSEALSLLRIDALLRRDCPGDSQAASDLSVTLEKSTPFQSIVGWSDCVELARARVAARFKRADAVDQLRVVVDTLEENAHRVLLDTHFAYARLMEAASEFGEDAVAARAGARHRYFSRRRTACDPRILGKRALQPS